MPKVMIRGIALLDSDLYVLREGVRIGRRFTEIAVYDASTCWCAVIRFNLFYSSRTKSQ